MALFGQKSRQRAARELGTFLERANLHDYLEQQNRPWVLIRNNLLAGIARGFGIVIGATILIALVLLLLGWLGGLPYIGDLFKYLGQSIRSDG